MKNSKTDKLYDKIEELEKKRIAYLEIDRNSDANRIKRQIEKIELEIRVEKLEEIEKELKVYRRVALNYPSLLVEVKRELKNLNWALLERSIYG